IVNPADTVEHIHGQLVLAETDLADGYPAIRQTQRIRFRNDHEVGAILIQLVGEISLECPANRLEGNEDRYTHGQADHGKECLGSAAFEIAVSDVAQAHNISPILAAAN